MLDKLITVWYYNYRKREREVLKMKKTLVFDMDGTIADLYGVNGWLENLREENARPYIEAKPLYDMNVLTSILELLRLNGWTIAITSWLSKESTKAYDKKVREAKKNGLQNTTSLIMKSTS